MNSALLLKFGPYAFVVAVVLALCVQTVRLGATQDELLAFKVSVKTLGDQAALEKARIDKAHEANLKKVTEDHEAQLPAIRAGAVANYLARRVRESAAGGGPLPGDGAGLRLDDAAKSELVLDPAFIEDAAEDAAKLAAWQQYCALNHCPIKD